MNNKVQKFRIKRTIERIDEATKQLVKLQKQLKGFQTNFDHELVDCQALLAAWQTAQGAVQMQQAAILAQQAILTDLILVEQDLANQYVTQCEELD